MTNEFQQYIEALRENAPTDVRIGAWKRYLTALSAPPRKWYQSAPAIETPAKLTIPSERQHDSDTCGYVLELFPLQRCGEPANHRGRGLPRCAKHQPRRIWP